MEEGGNGRHGVVDADLCQDGYYVIAVLQIGSAGR
jgi:hypothetical protein